MSILKKGEIQNNEGEVLYPHTSMDLVFDDSGKTLENKLKEMEAAAYEHPETHPASMITGLPDIVNNLTESTTGKVLDASQGKVLNEEIHKFKNLYFSITYKDPDYEAHNHIKVIEKYWNEFPIGNSFVTVSHGSDAQVIVYKYTNDPNASYGSCIINRYDENVTKGTLINGHWQWNILHNNKKVDLVFTPNANITVLYNRSYLQNKKVYLDISLTHTDGSVFEREMLGTINMQPISYKTPIPILGNQTIDQNTAEFFGIGMISSNNIWALKDTTISSKNIILTGIFNV